MHTVTKLRDDLAALGGRPGTSVLMHSSYKSPGVNRSLHPTHFCCALGEGRCMDHGRS